MRKEIEFGLYLIFLVILPVGMVMLMSIFYGRKQ